MGARQLNELPSDILLMLWEAPFMLLVEPISNTQTFFGPAGQMAATISSRQPSVHDAQNVRGRRARQQSMMRKTFVDGRFAHHGRLLREYAANVLRIMDCFFAVLGRMASTRHSWHGKKTQKIKNFARFF